MIRAGSWSIRPQWWTDGVGQQFQVTFDWDELNRSLPPERQDSAFTRGCGVDVDGSLF